MLPLLLLLVASQVPAVPGEGTMVSFCKQGRLTACQELAKIDPAKAAELQAELAKAALSLEALRAAEEAAKEGAPHHLTPYCQGVGEAQNPSWALRASG